MNNAIEVLKRIKSEMTCVQLPAVSKDKWNREQREWFQIKQNALGVALLALEQKEQYQKSLDLILNLANSIMDDTTDGNTIIRTLRNSGLKLEQGKNYEWKRKEVLEK